MNKSFDQEAVFELQFWMQILGDHSRFIYASLAPSEEQFIEEARSFRDRFDQLLLRAKQSPSGDGLADLLADANMAAVGLRELKLSILKEHLAGNVKTSLPPTFFNHMLNELDESLRVLSYLVKGKSLPVFHPLHHDLLWLLDAAGHAGAIHDNLDAAEQKLKQRAEHFTKDWEAFYLKAVEMAGYLRTKLARFPALSRFHREVELEMLVFISFLHELEEMELKKESLGILSPLMADHMAREECYYLQKLAETTEVNRPLCDPTKPRTEV